MCVYMSVSVCEIGWVCVCVGVVCARERYMLWSVGMFVS